MHDILVWSVFVVAAAMGALAALVLLFIWIATAFDMASRGIDWARRRLSGRPMHGGLTTSHYAKAIAQTP